MDANTLHKLVIVKSMEKEKKVLKNDIKYNLAAKYVNISVVYYIDIIKNAERIHIVDSCFSCIVIPLLNMKTISPKEVKIYQRRTKSITISI